MMRNALPAGVTVALLGSNASAVHAQKAGDGCSLLQGAEIQALAGSTKVGTGQTKGTHDGIDWSLARKRANLTTVDRRGDAEDGHRLARPPTGTARLHR